MHTRILFSFSIAAVLGMSLPALASDLPQIKTSAKNAVPQCATPGRLGAFLKARNPALDPRFEHIAVEYMRHGEALGVRWDYAFFQMVLETGGLTFRNGNRQGDVRATQNNFAGLGATGKGEPGESFPDVSTGVLAHLQHIAMYSGERVENAVAERTRKVQEWGVLTSWQKSFKRPITFADLGAKWAPGSRSYSDNLESISDKFQTEFCSQPDPRPELVAAVRVPGQAAQAQPADAKSEKVSGAEIARKAIAEQRAEETATRSGLGAGSIAKGLPGPAVKIINAPQPEVAERAAEPQKAEPQKAESPKAEPQKTEPPKAEAKKADPAKPDTGKQAAKAAPPARQNDHPVVQQAAAPAAMAAEAMAKSVATTKPLVPATGQTCRVWTASYGGQKALIVQVVSDNTLNFTVLDVNEGQEAKEAEAFISAYAKGGSVAGEFANQSSALEKAFELCPEG
jgi:hypothetical protein